MYRNAKYGYHVHEHSEMNSLVTLYAHLILLRAHYRATGVGKAITVAVCPYMCKYSVILRDLICTLLSESPITAPSL